MARLTNTGTHKTIYNNETIVKYRENSGRKKKTMKNFNSLLFRLLHEFRRQV